MVRGMTAILPKDYQPTPAVDQTLHEVVGRIIDRNLDGSSRVETRLGVLMEYGHAAKELRRAHPEVPFRTAFHLVCTSAVHAIA
jgi:hypothetical protein